LCGIPPETQKGQHPTGQAQLLNLRAYLISLDGALSNARELGQGSGRTTRQQEGGRWKARNSIPVWTKPGGIADRFQIADYSSGTDDPTAFTDY
jgi:hypothetical protein